MTKHQNATQLCISVSDPLLFYVRMRNWNNHLKPLFDNLFVAVSPGPSDHTVPAENAAAIQQFFLDITQNDSSVTVDFLGKHMNNHGVNIRHLTQKYWNNICDTVLLMEDDDFIVDCTLLANYLKRIKNGEVDVIGATRGCTNNSKLMQFCKDVLMQDNVIENVIDHTQTHFTPTHLLFRKSVVDKNDPMEAYDHSVGETLNYRGREFVYDEPTSMDTFVEASLRMFNRINKVYEHRDFLPGTYGDYDEFSYYFSLGYHNTAWQVPTQAAEWTSKQYHYHIGSATCLCRFAFVQDDLFKQEMFPEINNFLEHPEWSWSLFTVMEIYRRYHIYKLFYNAVKNDAAFARFVPAYDANFALADDYFYNKIKINDIMKNSDRQILNDQYYVQAIQQIVGSEPL